jgi:glutamyl-tRNA synthetase
MDKPLRPVGRFAPTPSGRMHLGNVFAALISYLSVKSRGGEWVLRMEDLDTERTREEYAQILREDLRWLGLFWDRETAPQSQRSAVYDEYFARLEEMGLFYGCYCTRSQLHSVNAPHLSDGTYVYPGTCRNLTEPPLDRKCSWRVKVPDRLWSLTDLCQGDYAQNLSTDCGDFVVRRADGVYVYQLAVTVDDGEAGVTEVVRGVDLLSSAPRQMYLQELFGFSHPEYAHIPMLMAPEGRRLSKRDQDLDMGALRNRLKPEQLIGVLAHAAGLTETAAPISAKELATVDCRKHLEADFYCVAAAVMNFDSAMTAYKTANGKAIALAATDLVLV